MDQNIIGIDTHTSNHIVVAINMPSARLDAMSIPTTFGEYHGLDAWAAGLGDAEASGIEGAGSYGATRSRDFLAKGHTVLDVMRPNRQLRYLHEKSNSLDAGSAERSGHRLCQNPRREARANPI